MLLKLRRSEDGSIKEDRNDLRVIELVEASKPE